MSVRLNLYGFSLSRMRRLFKSQDHEAVSRIRDRMANDRSHLRRDELQGVSEILEKAVMTGVPFAGLGVETHEHWLAADALARYDQEWLCTAASGYHASAVRDLWPYGKHARPEIRAFLRGLVEGVPLFGQRLPSDGLVYAAISGEKLRSFEPGLADLREQVVYRAGRKKDPFDDDAAAATFVTGFCDWINQIREAGLDLWYCTA